ncbi:MAG: NUDIX domain-containing protein [bacterium]|nr:NUDIX domain-containing protein [bacterium]MDE0351596.1 NUDIX domain-containing protein [bacterium]
MRDSPVEQAAGGVVWREGAAGIEVLLVHRPGYDDWTFPKGKLESGECLLECARREVREEAGVRPLIGRYLGDISYTKQEGRRKVVHYWAMQAGEVDFVPSSEVDRVRWVDEASLADHVSYPTERSLSEGLMDGWRDPADRILLVRHADAGKRNRGPHPDSARPLSERGRAEAAGLIGALEGFPIDVVLTSYAARCRQTVTPVATARKRVPQLAIELWEESGPAEVRALLRNRPEGTSLLCSHRPIVGTILRTLVEDKQALVLEKGSTWVLDFADGELTAANYLFPPR